MPLRLSTPLLSVDAGKMHQIDTSNVENLFSMWTVFNRCAESMEEGRRLENLSWRLWNRETFCCDSKPKFPDTPTSTPTRTTTTHSTETSNRSIPMKQTPDLSASVESIASVESEDALTGTSPSLRDDKSNPLIERHSFSRSRCKPISSYTLERMVVDIKKTKINDRDDLNALSTSLTDSMPAVSIRLTTPPVVKPEVSASEKRQADLRASQSTISTAPIPSPASTIERSQTMGSDTSIDLVQSHSVVRGFAPSKISSSHRSSTSLAAGKSPVPIKTILRNAAVPSPASIAAHKGNFMLGGSSDDESSFDDSRSVRHSSSLTAGLKRPQQLQQPNHPPKMTTFREEVEIRGDQADEGAIDSDDSDVDSDISESAIEEEDDAWEDDMDNQSDRDQGLFQRVPSKPSLVSRRSLLTTGLHESERAAALTAQAIRSEPTSPQLPRQPKSKLSVQITEPPQTTSGIARSKPMAMPTAATQSHLALSPRTTRRNMLSTELTESLRQNLLWERQFKNTTSHAVFKRRHTAHDNLNKINHLPTPDSEGPSRKTSWDNVFNLNNEYNTRGW